MNVSRKVSLIALLTAVSVATDYLLVGVPNVKLMDGLVFLGANLFGFEVGGSVAILSWLVYGTINPYGSATPGLLLVLMGSETTYALAGWGMRRLNLAVGSGMSRRVVLGFVGFVCAAIYDFITNVYTGIYFYAGPIWNRVVYSLIMGIPFSIIHEVSDFLVFMLVVPVLISAFTRLGSEVKVESVATH
ncbi:hypothetical protein B9Q03_10390 [Candidatus Marsarchaeota G2 archaeon OSP_D]|jgi:hypothetical protein|uniref:ECF transporter S component n=1 Tax=Candidatus Marsarchaeota G2 archaeon OSP_D TaxID=1978157 RepID=A0A2R6AMD7_9ARCH|nr:MAG: hypothetical protein B9Q03_10390 [Candidatus Marsarchaeota G2 archaeon OSP_D]